MAPTSPASTSRPPVDVAALRLRARVVRAVRRTLDDEGFIEVEPPVLVDGPALEENLEPVRAGDGFLHTSPEFALKRVLAAGLPRIFAITPSFRAEEHGPHHGTEFTMLELYLSNARHLDLMPVVERLVRAAASAVGVAVPEFQRVTVAALYGGAPPDDDDAFFHTWVDRIEPTLTGPTWVLDWPARLAALAEVRGEIAERLELYVGGLELGNGFSELGDGEELRARFARSAATRQLRGRTPHPTDEGVIAASATMPRCAGIALGVDRLVMALTGIDDIARVRIPR